MATFDLSQIKPIPGFDSEKWLRKVRAEIRRETEGLTEEQILERLRRSSEQMRKKRTQYWAERRVESEPQT